MRAGRLRNKIEIQRRTNEQDAAGQPMTSWVKVVAVHADILQRSGMEAIKADAETSIVKASIRIRYREGIDAGMRVLLGSTIYDIKAVLPDVAKRRHVDLVCEVINGR